RAQPGGGAAVGDGAVGVHSDRLVGVAAGAVELAEELIGHRPVRVHRAITQREPSRTTGDDRAVTDARARHGRHVELVPVAVLDRGRDRGGALLHRQRLTATTGRGRGGRVVVVFAVVAYAAPVRARAQPGGGAAVGDGAVGVHSDRLVGV